MARGGNVRVSITGDASGLAKATRDAEGSLNRLGKSGSLAGRALRDVGHGAAYALGAGGFGGGLYALFDIAKKSREEFLESERVSKQTTAALKSTGAQAGVTAKDISNLANALKRKTAIDDEAVQSAENVLLTFTNVRNIVGKNNDIFSQATKATLDLSTAMGQDLKSSAVQIGKALNDPIKGITALQRIGVSFTQQQRDQVKELVKSGHALEAQKMILKELNTEFGGSAAKQKTAAKELQTSLGDVAENIGRKLAPTINDAATKLNKFVGQMQDGTGAGGRFAAEMKKVGGELKNLLGPVVDIAKWLGKHPALLKAAAAAWVTYKVIAIAQMVQIKVAALAQMAEIKLAATASFFGISKGKGSAAEKAGSVAGKAFAAGFITLGLAGFADDFGRWLADHMPTFKVKTTNIWGIDVPTGVSVSIGNNRVRNERSLPGLQKPGIHSPLTPLAALPDWAKPPGLRSKGGGGSRGTTQQGTFNTGGGGGGGGGGGNTLVSWARQMVGHFKETNGPNRGPELDKLQKQFGTVAAAWCAEFATEALVKAGAPKALLTTRVSDLRQWAQAGTHGLSKGFKTKPQVGDLMLFGDQHVGIVDKVNKNGTVTTIEGNTSGGGGVKRVTRKIGSGQFARVNSSYGGAGGSDQTLVDLAIGAGFTKAEARIAAAIALAESGGDPTAQNTNSDGSVDAGLWQINSVHKWAAKLDLFDPQQNAYAAHRVYKMQGWRAWTMYRNGQYKKYLGQAGALNSPAGFAPSFSDVQDRADRASNRKTLSAIRPDLSRATKFGQRVSTFATNASKFASRYSHQSSIFDFSDEDLDTVEGRKARAGEIDVLRGIKGQEYNADVAEMNALKAFCRRVKAAIQKLAAELKKKNLSPGHKGFVRALIKKYRDKYREAQAAIKALGGEIEDLKVEIAGLTDDINDLLKAPLEAPPDKQQGPGLLEHSDFYGTIEDRLAYIDAQVAAGDLTPAQGDALKLQTINENIGNPTLTSYDVLTLKGERNDITQQNTDATNAATDAIKALTEEIKRQNDQRDAIKSVSLDAAWKALADVISGQIGGYAGFGGRALTAGAGSTYRF